MTKYLITGGAGLVGSHIADLLVQDEDAQVVVLDDFSRGRRSNLETAARSHRLEIVEGDIRDRKLLDKLMPGVDVVFHQAAIRITQCAAEPRLAMDVLVNGTFEVIDAAVAAGVRKVVAASSASVYGSAGVFPTDEFHHPYDNDTLYGAAKLFGEGLLTSYQAMSGLDSIALRYFNVYGPRMDAHGVYTEVLIRWMERIEAGLPPLIFGDGSQTMDFVYVADVARANVLAAKAVTGVRVLNVGSGTETSLLQLAETLLRILGSGLSVQHEPERSVNAVRRRLADVTNARREIGFEARVSLEDGLRELVKWWHQTRELAGRG